MATFFNRATLSYNGGVVNSNVTRGEILTPISVTKTATVDEYNGDSQITFAVNIINAGSIAVDGITVNDDLGQYQLDTVTYQPLDYVDGSLKYFVNGVLQPAPAVLTDNGLQISGIAIPADGNVALLYTTLVNGFAPLEAGSQIENNLTLDGSCGEGIAATEIISVAEEINLDITKSLCPTTVTCDGNVNYTLEILNYGNRATVATDNLIVTDVFNPPFENITVTYNGAAWTQPDDYVYDPVSGVFQTVLGAITVPAASFERDAESGEIITTPGKATIVINGNL